MKFSIAVLLAALAAAPVLAHDDATLDTVAAPHGGQLRMAAGYHLELVVAPDASADKDHAVAVYVTDHAGAPQPAAGLSATALIQSGGKRAAVALKPDGDNRLSGVGRYQAGPDMKVVVSLVQADKPPLQARFTPLAKPVQHAQHDH